MSSELPPFGNDELTGVGILFARIATDESEAPPKQLEWHGPSTAAPGANRGIADSSGVIGVSHPSVCLKLLEQFDDGALAERSQFALLRLEQY
ncbi:hypothetical protein [Arthrobacter sp. fls2-241-R2A-200]|uniref:hypothetical protein n=1 Tax=Arthrobacter sp. fls2-241-R2A-200 TaxID=3040281 RepID=UPI00254C724A|nr:hypothetical protein [Arthrobacter sp. fls2-241-R2A-200]